MSPKRTMVHRKTVLKWGRVLFPFLFISLSTLQCGIPSYPYLYPPYYVKESQKGETTFQFSNDTRTNILYLKGYEIYYKFYSDDTGDTTYTSDKTQLEAITNEDLTLPTLQNLKFHRMYENQANPGSYTKPLLSIEGEDKNDDFTVTIDFSFLDADTKPFPLVTFSASSIEIARYIKVDGSIEYFLKSFLAENFQNTYTYSDFDESLSLESFFNIALVVFTYGVDESLSELYSLPLHLGRIRLTR